MLEIELGVVRDVVHDDVAIERLEQPDHFFADVAAAVDADRAAGQAFADAHPRALAAAHRHVERHDAAQREDHVAQRQLRDREPVRAGGVAEVDAVFAQRVEIERVAADAHLADDLELRQRGQHAFGDRLHAHDRAVAPGEQLDHLGLGRRSDLVPEDRVGKALDQFRPQHRVAREQAVGDADLQRDHRGCSATTGLRSVPI